MISVILSLGSNAGERHKLIADSLELLKRHLISFEESSSYETPAVGNSKGSYLNCVVSAVFNGTHGELEVLCKDIEKQLGRTGASKAAGVVPIDIDIVMVDDKVVKTWDFRQEFFRIGYSQLTHNKVISTN